MRYGMLSILLFVAGFGLGWVYAHSVVASECKKLGKFYVGDQIFTCTQINRSSDEESI